MCYGEVGTIRGFVYKCNCKIPLIEIDGNISEIPIPITDDVKVGDRIMVYNSYKFDYEFEPVEFNITKKVMDIITNCQNYIMNLLKIFPISEKSYNIH
jgi:hypothetical protein